MHAGGRSDSDRAARETFASRSGLILTTVGVAVGLGNVWRFPYMAGAFGGAAFVLTYLAAAFLIGVPGLVAEWTLGRHTRRGPVGAFDRAGLPGGRPLGGLFFLGVAAATAYYIDAIGWVFYHGLGQIARGLGLADPGASPPGAGILPPDSGVDPSSLSLQLLCTGGLVVAAVIVLRRGLRDGIEAASKVLTPLLFATLIVLIVRAVTLEGAAAGLRWYLLKFRPGDLTAGVVLGAVGQAVFSLALGGTFMVVYGSHMDRDDRLVPNAGWTAVGDVGAGLLAGLAVFPAVFALGLEPGAGPELIFSTLPQVFARVPGGWTLGALFFMALAGAAFLSALAALEVLVAGLCDEGGFRRRRAVLLAGVVVLVFAVPPMVNMEIFVPWDLAFGSGMQTFGALIAVVTVGWALDRGAALSEIAGERDGPPVSLYLWIRWVVPGAVLATGVWWWLTEVA